MTGMSQPLPCRWTWGPHRPKGSEQRILGLWSKQERLSASPAVVIFLANMSGARNFTQTVRDADGLEKAGEGDKEENRFRRKSERWKEFQKSYTFFKAPEKPLRSQKRNKPAWTPTVGLEVFPPENRERSYSESQKRAWLCEHHRPPAFWLLFPEQKRHLEFPANPRDPSPACFPRLRDARLSRHLPLPIYLFIPRLNITQTSPKPLH